MKKADQERVIIKLRKDKEILLKACEAVKAEYDNLNMPNEPIWLATIKKAIIKTGI